MSNQDVDRGPDKCAASNPPSRPNIDGPLKIGALYILLFIRQDPPQPNDYHWAFYLHTGHGGGMKYHVSSLTGGWLSEHAPLHGVMKSFLLAGFFHIATLPCDGRNRARGGRADDDKDSSNCPIFPKELFENIDRAMRTYDGVLNERGITCRTWALDIMALLQEIRLEEHEKPILQCENLLALEKEIMEFGNRHRFSARDAVQPRPVEQSALCSGL